jgi:hypothetical protein
MFSVFASPAVAGIELRRTMREGPSDVPARAVLAALVTGPLALMITQRLLLGRDATEILLLVAAGTAGATGIRLSPTLRDKNASELLSWVKVRPVAGQVALAAFIVSEGIAAGRSGVHHAQHRGVAAALANKDACDAVSAWAALKPGDLELATTADRDEAARLQSVCTQQRVAKTRADATAATTAYAGRCTEAARHMTEGKLTDADRATVRERPLVADEAGYFDGELGAALADRIAKKDLVVDDLGTSKRLPCGPGARQPFFQAAAASKGMWASIARAPSDGSVLLALGASPSIAAEQGAKVEAPLSIESKTALHRSAETAASRQIGLAKSSYDCQEALTLCAIDGRFGSARGPSCTALASVSAAFVRSEQAAAVAAKHAEDSKAKAAADVAAAKSAACDAETKAWQTCEQPCWDLTFIGGHDDEALACGDRCEARHPRPSCK